MHPLSLILTIPGRWATTSTTAHTNLEHLAWLCRLLWYESCHAKQSPFGVLALAITDGLVSN